MYTLDSSVAIAACSIDHFLVLVLCCLDKNIATQTVAVLEATPGLQFQETDPAPFNEYQANLGHPVQDSVAYTAMGTRRGYLSLLSSLLEAGLISQRVYGEIDLIIGSIS